MRPVFVVLGKETKENLGNVKNTLNERKNISDLRIETVNNNQILVEIAAEMTMIDGKMRAMISGLGGAFCLLCKVDKNTACGISGDDEPVPVESFFYINRDCQETRANFERLVDESGCVKRSRGDYKERHGVTQEPLIDEDLNCVSPLHSLMRSFDFLKILMYHLRSETFIWTDSSLKLGRSAQFLTKAKDEVREEILLRTGLPLDAADPTGMGGNSNKGDLCKRLMTDHRELLVSLVPERFREDFRELICRIWIWQDVIKH